MVNLMAYQAVVHPEDEKRLDPYRVKCLHQLLESYNQAIENLGEEYEMYLMTLECNLDGDTHVTKKVSEHLVKAAEVRHYLFWHWRRLQLERRLQGELSRGGFGGSMTKIVTTNRIQWLYNLTMERQIEAHDIGLPVSNCHLQFR